MDKGQAFAIATQQSHSLGKSPKGYGTVEGRREAKNKYDTPEDDKKTASRQVIRAAKELLDNLDKPVGNVIQDKIVKKKEASYYAAKYAAACAELAEKRAFQTSMYSTAIEGPKVARPESSQPPFRKPPIGRVLEKEAFTQSAYGSTGGFVDFHQVSSQPGFKKPRLDKVLDKEGDFEQKSKKAGAISATGLTPAARLNSSMRVGQPKVTNPAGPSIADIAKPKGFGKAQPGATIGL